MNQMYFQTYMMQFGTEKGNRQIFSFDLEEETSRHEPWTVNSNNAKENLDCFLKGKKYYKPIYNKDDINNIEEYIDYSKNIDINGTKQSFVEAYKDKKFVETIGEYEYSNTQETDSSAQLTGLVKKKKKRMIIYTLINSINSEEEV